jgi:hypothetical protein
MTIRPTVALKLSTSPKTGYDRMSQMAAMREAFLELEYYLENLAEKRYEEELKKEEKEIDVPPEEARKRGRKLIRDEHLDDKHLNLVKLTDGRLAAWIYCGAATDVAPAVKTAKDNGFLDRTVFVLGTEAYRAVAELKEAGRPVVLSPELVHRERDPITGELSETFVPKIIQKAGIEFALQPSPGSSLAERYLGYQAARCVRHGVPRQKALEAITLNPAKILGVDDRLGSLEVGKAAYVVVLSGDPLDFNSWVETTYIRGVLAYDRDKDVRLKQLLELEKKAAEAAEKKKPAAKAAKKKPPAEAKEKQKPVAKDGKKKEPAKKEEAKKKPEKKQPKAARKKGGEPRKESPQSSLGEP